MEGKKEKNPFSGSVWKVAPAWHERGEKSRSNCHFFCFCLFPLLFFTVIFYIIMLYVAQYIKTKVMFNLQSFIYSMY